MAIDQKNVFSAVNYQDTGISELMKNSENLRGNIRLLIYCERI